MRTWLLMTWATPLVVVLVVPRPAAGLEQLSGGVSLGGFQAGTVPQFAVSPHAGISWRIGSDFVFTIHDLCSFKCNSDEDTESQSDSPLDSGTGDSSSEEALVKKMLEDPEPEGGVICGAPTDCVEKCVAASKYCWAGHAVHPYKPPEVGNLIDCIDSFPSAKWGGSYLCLYEYPSGDTCAFSYGSKIGPIHFPAPPPLCIYKSKK